MSKIAWTEKTWNPIVGCSIVSLGCTNCYAMKMANRICKMQPDNHYQGTVKLVNNKPVWTGKLAQAPVDKLMEPLKRKKPTTYFVNSMGDLFHEDVPDEWIDKVFGVMARRPQHTFQVLTKRADRMHEYMRGLIHRESRYICREGQKNIDPRDGTAVFLLNNDNTWPLPNVWLGVSAENQEQADARIPHLLDTPAAVRFVSVEPQLEEIDIIPYMGERAYKCGCDKSWHHTEINRLNLVGNYADCLKCGQRAIIYPTLDWAIQGCESGPNRRPFNLEWAVSMRDQCAETNTAYFLKQIQDETGKVITDPLLDGIRHNAIPTTKGGVSC